ncbi:hypothetical protein EHW66_05020 [Erwinia psidii]|uniref:hypothetical protein n=1 Tax=Erwinia psidii TaxID=69224 RepID=UPI00226BBB74|nr:hypothetical protein [Erwinia psidii]MCX8964394.1 hypothetical protein [Erwinia psidii]
MLRWWEIALRWRKPTRKDELMCWAIWLIVGEAKFEADRKAVFFIGYVDFRLSLQTIVELAIGPVIEIHHRLLKASCASRHWKCNVHL